MTHPVTVRITQHENPQFKKVEWFRSDGKALGFYVFRLTRLAGLADTVRKKLGELVKTESEKGPALKELAQAGFNLYTAFFDNAEGDSEVPKRIRDWLDSQTEPFRIILFVDPTVHIPWALMYARNPSEQHEGVATELYPDFWCFRYNPAAMHYLIPPLDGEAIEPDRFALLPVIDRAVYKTARKGADGDVRALIGQLVRNGFLRPVYTKADLFKRWLEFVATDGLLFFLCHGDERHLSLGGEKDYVDVEDFHRLRRERDHIKDTGCLVFLNACFTAAGSPYDEAFLEATGRQGFFGFIGVEAEVPKDFALAFGSEFIRRLLYTGQPVYEIMDAMRRSHWPFSLLYAVCCDPLLSVKPRQPLPVEL